jgi:photosystem II stability/assembly factor-like uncharacterized protein
MQRTVCSALSQSLRIGCLLLLAGCGKNHQITAPGPVATSEWVQISGTGGLVYGLAVAVTGVYAATSWGVARSPDNGASWTSVSTGLPAGYGVHAIAVKGTSLFAGTAQNGVFRSTDGGATWAAANNGVPANSWVRAFVGGEAAIYLGTQGNGAFRSTDGGTTWTAINTGLTDSDVSSLALNGTSLFAGTEGSGVFRSTDNGSTWSSASNGLPSNSAVLALGVTAAGVFAGTQDAGLF